MKDIFVIVAENDQPHKMIGRDNPLYDDNGPIVFEQYTNASDLETVKKRAKQLEGRYGKCRIAKLEFIDGEEG